MHIRQISIQDRFDVDELLTTATHLSVQVSWDKLPDILFKHPTLLARQEDRLGCIFGLTVEPETVARLNIFALRNSWPVLDTLSELLPYATEVLRHRAVDTLAHLGTEPWLVEALLSNGFRPTDAIITLQKTHLAVPSAGNADVIIRPAIRADLSTLVEIDRLAFDDPLWHHTVASLNELGRESTFLIVAEIDHIVGYAYGTAIGRHGHLSRIAVHPQWQGQQIGVRLLAEAIERFKAHRVFGITLNTQQDNTRSRRLYEWFGFEVLGVEARVLKKQI
ncbi:MAG: GNAT family N-acetyltransferase [Anaerolineae bacterium]|nr:GNAT family N-acetyltransferase [Anaerolineae bacterium]